MFIKAQSFGSNVVWLFATCISMDVKLTQSSHTKDLFYLRINFAFVSTDEISESFP